MNYNVLWLNELWLFHTFMFLDSINLLKDTPDDIFCSLCQLFVIQFSILESNIHKSSHIFMNVENIHLLDRMGKLINEW